MQRLANRCNGRIMDVRDRYYIIYIYTIYLVDVLVYLCMYIICHTYIHTYQLSILDRFVYLYMYKHLSYRQMYIYIYIVY